MVIMSGPWIGERRMRKLCDKAFSHPLYFLGQQPSPLPSECLKEDVVCSELLCTFSTAALSLQKPSPWTVCLHAAQHWLYDKHSLGWSIVRTAHKEPLPLWDISNTFSAQGCHLVARTPIVLEKMHWSCLIIDWKIIRRPSITFTIFCPLFIPRRPLLLSSEFGLSFSQLFDTGLLWWFVAL